MDQDQAESHFVAVQTVIPDIIQDIRYYSPFNFVGTRITGYEAPLALLTRKAADALAGVQEEVRKEGLSIKIYDAYRPQTAVNHFLVWAEGLDNRMKVLFYPDTPKSQLFELGYLARRSGHSRGSTLDLTLTNPATRKDIDVGSPFDFFSDISHYEGDGTLTSAQMANRRHLRDVMTRHGFAPMQEEWWHFTLKGEPFPDTYFSFPITRKFLERDGKA